MIPSLSELAMSFTRHSEMCLVMSVEYYQKRRHFSINTWSLIFWCTSIIITKFDIVSASDRRTSLELGLEIRSIISIEIIVLCVRFRCELHLSKLFIIAGKCFPTIYIHIFHIGSLFFQIMNYNCFISLITKQHIPCEKQYPQYLQIYVITWNTRCKFHELKSSERGATSRSVNPYWQSLFFRYRVQVPPYKVMIGIFLPAYFISLFPWAALRVRRISLLYYAKCQLNKCIYTCMDSVD